MLGVLTAHWVGLEGEFCAPGEEKGEAWEWGPLREKVDVPTQEVWQAWGSCPLRTCMGCVSRDRRAGGHAVHVSQGVGSGVMVFMSPETGCLGHMGFMSLQAG